MDSWREKQLFATDDSEPMSDGEARLRETIELVHPLVRNGSNPALVDIADDIIYPAGQWEECDQRDLMRLCEIFRVVLERIGNTILATLATYIATSDGEHTLKHFLGEMEHLVQLLGEAYDTSLIEAFHMGFTKELDGEPF